MNKIKDKLSNNQKEVMQGFMQMMSCHGEKKVVKNGIMNF